MALRAVSCLSLWRGTCWLFICQLVNRGMQTTWLQNLPFMFDETDLNFGLWPWKELKKKLKDSLNDVWKKKKTFAQYIIGLRTEIFRQIFLKRTNRLLVLRPHITLLNRNTPPRQHLVRTSNAEIQRDASPGISPLVVVPSPLHNLLAFWLWGKWVHLLQPGCSVPPPLACYSLAQRKVCFTFALCKCAAVLAHVASGVMAGLRSKKANTFYSAEVF